MAVISGVALTYKSWADGEGWQGWLTMGGIQLEKTPRGVPSSSHMTSTSPHKSQTTIEDEANV